MRTDTRLAKWGTSLAVRISKPLQEAAHLKAGDNVKLDLDDGVVVIRPVRGKPRLKNLVEAITPENCHSETDWGTARGKKIW